MAPLPEDRLEATHAFDKCSVDYFGPLMLKRGEDGVMKKIWTCMFVCLVTRGVHLEMVTDLSSQQFLMAFERFCARKGQPSVMWSDQAKTFIRANKELQNLLSTKSKAFNNLTAKSLNWQFVHAYSPSTAGAWESLVKSSKAAISKIVGKSQVTFEEFPTVLCQAEACINSRPLYTATSDPNDLDPITPAMLLLGRNLRHIPNPLDGQKDLPKLTTHLDVEKRRKYRDLVAQHFWRRFRQEYLLQACLGHAHCEAEHSVR